MSELIRLSLSIEEPLYKQLEKLVDASGYQNRSEFIRDMIRDRLVSDEWKTLNHEVIGTITLVYDHHKRELSEKLTELQHEHHHQVMATTHLHLNRELCAEMIMVKGCPEDVRKLSNQLRKQKGVLHSGLTMSSTGQKLD
jgi:CopG family nickel-responsive transcriptional regulator